MAERKLRKIKRKLEGRIAAYEADNKKPGKHEHHKPGSQNLRKR